MIALTCIAIYVQVTSSTLSLPISTGTTVVTILLPLFAAANVFYTPILIRLSRSSRMHNILLPALHIIQSVLTVVIATLTFQGLLPGQNLKCNLGGNWQRLYSEQDGRAIERIQNAFDCCGFNSVQHLDWPKMQCENIYKRHTACAGPWTASMQRTSGLEFMVAIVVGIVQLAHLAYLRRRGFSGVGTQDYKRIPQPVEAGESERFIENGQEVYHDRDIEDDVTDQDDPQSPSGSAHRRAPPRVVPSGLGHDEANQWRS
ncbi:hypothetical protein F5Y19DRAFT_458221 [Xylariaceae sp. FL1651]|nr:hypothetical protein F5Y19DRAFT_458221 [Xylariaceae sp. FL1651]